MGHIDPIPAGQLAVSRHVLLLRRQSKRGNVEPRNAAEVTGRHMPAQTVVGKIGKRISERGELPVEHGEYLRLGRMEDHIVEPEIAVDDTVGGLRRDIPRQPLDEIVHGLDALGL